jgi:DNA-directed RNA polymerase specialized sigma subunit
MAELRDRRPRRRGSTRTRFSSDEIASALMPSRDRLVDQVPHELAGARGMSREQWELAVDDAIGYLALEYDVPIRSEEELQRAFWWSTSLRVKQLRDGRASTVRGRWSRVDIDDVDVASSEPEPERQVVERSERAALLEFAATLTEVERQVFSCKYGGRRERGRTQIVRQLGLRMGDVRSAEASIKQKLERFVAIVAAGRLCAYRASAMAALGSGELTEEAEHAARIHLEHCPACRLEHAARLRALRSGRLPRDIAQLLPAAPTADRFRSPRALWDALTDWTSRILPHESTITGAQIGLAGRGLGTLAATKLAALCVGGITVVGGAFYCAETQLGAKPAEPPHHVHASKPAKEPHHRPAEPPATAQAKWMRAKAIAAATPAPKPHRKPQPQQPKTATSHERDNAVSPAPARSAAGGASEFGPTSTGSSTPPAKAVTSGGPEFP